MVCSNDSYVPLIYPGNPEFEAILGCTLPLNWRQDAWNMLGEFCFVVGESGLMRTATLEETREYLEGGEYDKRLTQIEDQECQLSTMLSGFGTI